MRTKRNRNIHTHTHKKSRTEVLPFSRRSWALCREYDSKCISIRRGSKLWPSSLYVHTEEHRQSTVILYSNPYLFYEETLVDTGHPHCFFSFWFSIHSAQYQFSSNQVAFTLLLWFSFAIIKWKISENRSMKKMLFSSFNRIWCLATEMISDNDCSIKLHLPEIHVKENNLVFIELPFPNCCKLLQSINEISPHVSVMTDASIITSFWFPLKKW